MILDYEYWFQDYEEDEEVDCNEEWDYNGLDEKFWGYNGDQYKKGKNTTKDLYCSFYEKHGFIEKSELNTKSKCFEMDPLPSMEIDLDKHSIDDLINVFFEPKCSYQEQSKFCQNYFESKSKKNKICEKIDRYEDNDWELECEKNEDCQTNEQCINNKCITKMKGGKLKKKLIINLLNNYFKYDLK